MRSFCGRFALGRGFFVAQTLIFFYTAVAPFIAEKLSVLSQEAHEQRPSEVRP
jgi:hypothetical protein